MAKPAAVIVGVGPGLGAALAERFARGGFDIGLVARSDRSLEAGAERVAKAGGRSVSAVCDATDASSVARAFQTLRGELGPIDVLVYNAGAFVMKGVLDLSVDEFEGAWRSNCLGGFLAAREVLPGMLERSRGTLLFTGATASLRGAAKFGALAVGKFGLRALAQSLARELGPQGVHVAHVVVDGIIDTPRTRAWSAGKEANELLSPDALAETYFQIHAQPVSAWTHELDVRPQREKF